MSEGDGDLQAHRILRAGDWPSAELPAAADRIRLGYAERFLRRKRLRSEGGIAFLLDLPRATALEPGDALLLADGRGVEVQAAEELLLAVAGPDLARLAWHIGNRHTPCQIEADRLLIAEDHVLEAMLKGLGATVTRVSCCFRPEGGAYGTGRVMGHEGAAGHGHVHHHGSHERPDEEELPAPDEAP